MLSKLKEASLAIGFYFVMMTHLLFVIDAIGFHTNNYKTPWYYISFSSPYTNLVLTLFGEKHEYWTNNAIGTERWNVREVKYKDQTYWTILERKEN